MKSEQITVLIIAALIVIIFLYILYKKNQENLDEIDEKSENVNTENNSIPILGVYYTEWCGYSQQFLRALKEEIIPALEQNNLDKAFQIKLVDCDKHKEECAKNNIPGFPTLLLHKNNSVVPYEGNRKADDLIRFLKQNI